MVKISNGFTTRAIHVGEDPELREGGSGDVVSPIHLATTFARREADSPTAGYEYSRSLNPTRKALEGKYASLEKAAYGLAFSSGLSAQTTVLLSLLRRGDKVLAGNDLYGGSKRIFNQVLPGMDITTAYLDMSDPKRFAARSDKQIKLVWIESPTNPLLQVADIRALAKIAREKGWLLVVDNTFLSPYFQNPLELGADIVVHSASKYLAGHSDVVSGAVMLNNPHLYEKIKFNQNAIGTMASPFDSYLVMRGLKTLSLRMEQHQRNALAIAQFLSEHAAVKRVLYPGLPSHPQYAVSLSQSSGFGGMVSFELHGDGRQARKFLERLRLFHLAESLGGVESLIEIPAVMTHASLSAEVRASLGITDTLIRASVGVEDQADLLRDLQHALA